MGTAGISLPAHAGPQRLTLIFPKQGTSGTQPGFQQEATRNLLEDEPLWSEFSGKVAPGPLGPQERTSSLVGLRAMDSPGWPQTLILGGNGHGDERFRTLCGSY